MKKRFEAFISVGILGVCATVATTDTNVQNFVDSNIYRVAEKTYFKPVEDFRYDLLKHVAKDNSLLPYRFEDTVDVAEYKNSLKDKEFFKNEVAALDKFSDDANKAKQSANKVREALPDLDFPKESKREPVVLDLFAEHPAKAQVEAKEQDIAPEVKTPKIIMGSIQSMRAKYNEATGKTDYNFDFSDVPQDSKKHKPR